MEHEKKKRQKKKKNKQGKPNTSASTSVGDLTSENNYHVTVRKQNHQNLNSESDDVQNKGLQQRVVDSDIESISGAENSRVVEAEKSYWLNREASLEEKIKELQEQLERNVSQTQKERNLWHQEEAELEARILKLQNEKDSWLQKEAVYEEKINQLVEETSTLRSIGVSFKEKCTQMEEEKVKLAQREDVAAETIASLNKDNARLRVQVVELEASRNDISHQNQQLKELVSDLRSKIQNLKDSSHVAENENMKSQLEFEQTLVEKLLSENEKLVEKVNILNAEKSVTTESSLPVKNPEPSGIDESSGLNKTDPNPLSSENSDPVSPPPEPKEGVNNVNEAVRLTSESLNQTNSEGSDLNGEIVQIPLDEKEEAVALTDAPLIGAPFRLMSFVARYVSGADLVHKS